MYVFVARSKWLVWYLIIYGNGTVKLKEVVHYDTTYFIQGEEVMKVQKPEPAEQKSVATEQKSVEEVATKAKKPEVAHKG